jgi:chemotaxis protein methyltransferase WspC
MISELVKPALERIDERLRHSIGLNAESLGANAIALAVRTRMGERGVGDAQAYALLLDGEPAEFAALIEELVVPETWFFREADAFRDMCARATALIRSEPGSTFRVLSIPCSTGEEPYTIAMALLDAGFVPGRFEIEAIDISRRALTVAERGIYGSNSFRDKDLSFRDRYFSRSHDGFAIHPIVRDSVRLMQKNLLEPSLLAGHAPYHAIFCRNVLIYLHGDARETALVSLDRMLAPNGVVFAGHAEALEAMTPRFRRARSGCGFAYVRNVPIARPIAGEVAATAQRPPDRERRELAPRRGGSARSRRPAGTVPVSTAEHDESSLARAKALADRGELTRAAQACEQEITSRPSAGAYCLLGVVRQAQSNLQAAEECFARALYLEPSHREALLYMALLCEARGNNTSAENYLRRANRATRNAGAR